jgi:hypothetical protein
MHLIQTLVPNNVNNNDNPFNTLVIDVKDQIMGRPQVLRIKKLKM